MHRGNANNEGDITAYEMYISIGMRTIYDGLFILHDEILNSNNHDLDDVINQSKLGDIFDFFRQKKLDVNVLATYMNNQLKAKMEHCFDKEKIETKSFMQKFLDFPPENIREQRDRKEVVLYKDSSLSYDEVLSEIYFVLDIEFNLSKQDVYVNIMGGIEVDEPAADLGIALAIATCAPHVVVDSQTVIIGEIGLSGEIRAVSNIEKRITEAQKLGFKRIIIPESNEISSDVKGIEIVKVKKIVDALTKLMAN